jgi:hypothetical protein
MIEADQRFVANIKKVDTNANVEVIGGAPTDGTFPETVVLEDKSGARICTGTLIAKRIVLTARHCLELDKVGLKDTPVKFGDDRKQPTKTIEVDEAIPMPQNPSSPEPASDIALVRLKADADATPVSIAAESRVTANAALRVVGFGRVDAGTSGKKFTVRIIIASYDCRGKVVRKGEELTDKQFYGCKPVEMVAAGKIDPTTRRSADTCNGDSGGPAFVAPADMAFPADKFETTFESRAAPPRYALAAVTSHGISTGYIRGGELRCGQGGVYTRLSGNVSKVGAGHGQRPLGSHNSHCAIAGGEQAWLGGPQDA